MFSAAILPIAQRSLKAAAPGFADVHVNGSKKVSRMTARQILYFC